MFDTFDVIVVGAGHAGCEAAAVSANMGAKTLLITMNMQTIAQMSCNPAMGGIAKGQIVREIDALGGYSGIISDLSTIQFRMLNKSKGPGMWSPRSQNDRMLFAAKWREQLEALSNLSFWQDTVSGLIVSRGTLQGVTTSMGQTIYAKAVVLTNGTFLNGTIHIGEKQFGGGRIGEKGVQGLTEQLVSLGFEAARLKTGTPPRVDGRSLDYSKMEVQYGDDMVTGFSFLPTQKVKPQEQRHCWITYTNAKVHDILREGFDKSPMYQGRIKGSGPRYCPSVEDKVSRFADKDRHQIFVEPEGWHTVEIYVNGFSTSLPEEIQFKAIREIPGFENVKFFRPGYAIEYDYFPPTQLKATLETKKIDNLFFAGQINGTTGYEEAAGQGIIAGINAVLKIRGEEPFILKRNESYIGVLIDDLINKGTDEPYRMFTSRAEYRTLLRQDNADMRLTPKAIELGIASEERKHRFQQKQKDIESVKGLLNEIKLNGEIVNSYLEDVSGTILSERQRVNKVILRPNVTIKGLMTVDSLLNERLSVYNDEVLEAVELELKYEVYIQKEKEMAERLVALDDLFIPEKFDYNKLQSLSIEARQKLTQIQPRTLGQASRISGVNPSDLQALMVYMGR